MRTGQVWCGGTRGEIYRLPGDGSRLELVEETGGYSLGMSFDRAGALYVCDLTGQTVLRRDPAGGVAPIARFAGPRRIVTPNVPVVDHARGCLYVSDSNVAHEPGGGIWRIDLESGAAAPWWDVPLDFANGLALDPGRDVLYVAESWGHRVSAVQIRPDGTPGEARVVVEGLEGIVDGLGLDAEGRLYLAFYAPSQIGRIAHDGTLEILIRDPLCDLLCHPTNIAWLGTDLLTANLGAHHLTRIPLDVGALDVL